MTCAEFQKVLPYIIESGGNLEEEDHLRTCTICSDLVRDLRYIAEQAKLLVPMEDPNPRVWDGIQKSLEHEGIVKPGKTSKGGSGGPLKMTVKVTCVGILGLAVILLVARSYASTTIAGHAAPVAVQTSTR
jgi:hypothetical protein